MMIKVHNPVHSQLFGDIKKVLPIFSQKKVVWYVRGGKKSCKEVKSLAITKSGIFGTGLIPKVQKLLPEVVVSDPNKILCVPESTPPIIYGKELWDHQKEAIEACRANGRGLVIMDTGLGKTLVECGVISSFPNERFLFVTSGVSLLKQHRESVREYLKVEPGYYDAKEKRDGPIVLATRKSVANWPKEKISEFSAIIIDECHKAGSKEYEKILNNTNFKLRFGFTATHNPDDRKRLTIEGLLGVEIFNVNKNESEKFLATTNIRISRIPFNMKLKFLSGYENIFREGVIENKMLHRVVCDLCVKLLKKDRFILIMTGDRTEIGKNLATMLENRYNISVPFVFGEMNPEKREILRKEMVHGSRRILITNHVFCEGIDIPRVTDIIVVGIGKSEIRVLQTIGRGRRKTAHKHTVTVWDFFDKSNPKLVEHFGERFCFYMEKGLIK